MQSTIKFYKWSLLYVAEQTKIPSRVHKASMAMDAIIYLPLSEPCVVAVFSGV